MANIEKVRNIGVVAHIDAGKTTVTERFLYYSGRIHRIGEVHQGDTQMDWRVQERERGITITAATTLFQWRDHEIHLLDTPGHVDFTIEVERSLRVLDGAVVVFSAVDGVEPQSETVWHQADKFKVPRLAFVNKMDRVGACFDSVVSEITRRLGARPAPIQIPIGTEGGHRGVVDLVNPRALWFTGEEADPPTEGDIPPELVDEARRARERLVEVVADVDEELAESFLAGTPVSAETLRAAIRRACVAVKVVPVLAGAALRNKGIQPLLDAVVDYLPSPVDLPPVEGTDPASPQRRIPCPPQNKAPLAALAFKVEMHEGRKVVYVRLFSGQIRPGDEVYNPRLRRTEKVARLFQLHAEEHKHIEVGGAGMIVAAMGLKNTTTGDTLCAATAPVLLERIDTYEPVIATAVEPATHAEKERMTFGLGKLADEDPTLCVQEDPETGQTILRGMGELHLEVVLDRLGREYGVQVRAGKPQVVFRETLTRSAERDSHFERRLEDGAIFGEARVRVTPRLRHSGNELRLQLPDLPPTPPAIAQAALEGLREAALSGPQGYPLQDVEAVVLGVTIRDGASPEIGARIATAEAFRRACADATPRLLEPVMAVEVIVPEDFLGPVIGDLNARHGRIEDVTARGEKRVIQVRVPLQRMFGYSTDLRSLSQGRGTFTMQFAEFDCWTGR